MFKLLILDVDGVLTTGLKTYDTNGKVISKTFSDRDFTAIKQFICSGVKVIFLSGDNQINSIIAKNRKIDFFYSRKTDGQLSKSECAREILNKHNLSLEQVIFVGDDLFDIEMRARVIILGVDGVQEITSMELALVSRVLTLTFVAKTTYGEISLTVPWSK